MTSKRHVNVLVLSWCTDPLTGGWMGGYAGSGPAFYLIQKSKYMNAEQRLLAWIETEMKPAVSSTNKSLLQMYLSSSKLMSSILQHLYDINISGPAVFTTLLRTLMPGEKDITMDDVFVRDDLYQDVVSLLNQRILRKSHFGRSLEETTKENIYHTLAAFDACQQRKERLLEALEVVEADIFAQQRELKSAVQAMSSEIADLLLKCESSAKAQKPRPTVTFADTTQKAKSIVTENDSYYEEVEELTIDELSSPSASYAGNGPGNTLTTTDDKRITELQDNIQRITVVLKAYKEQQDESAQHVRDANAQIRLLTEMREENHRYQLIINDLNDNIGVYKRKLADLSRDYELLQAKFTSTKSSFGTSSHVERDRSSPSLHQTEIMRRASAGGSAGGAPRTPDTSTRSMRASSQSRATDARGRNLQSSVYQRKGTPLAPSFHYQPQQSTPTQSAATKINELRVLVKQKESIIIELNSQIANLTRTADLSAKELKAMEEKYKNLLIRSDRLRSMVRAVEDNIKKYSLEDPNLVCNPTGRDVVELLSSFYHLLRDRCYEFARRTLDVPASKSPPERMGQVRRTSDLLDTGTSRGHDQLGGYGHQNTSVERENERLRAMVHELSSGKASFERRLSQLEGQISQQNKRADETRRDPLFMSGSLNRSTRLDRSLRSSSRGKGYEDRYRRSSSEYEYSGDYDDLSLNNLTYRLRSDSKRIAMLTSDSKRPRSSRRY